MKTAVITEPSAFLYQEDLVSPADQLFMGWAVGILEEERKFYYVVTHYGYLGYLKKDKAKVISQDKLKSRDEAGRYQVVRAPFVDVLLEPRVQGKRLMTLEKGSFVELFAFDGDDFCQREKENKGFVKVHMASGDAGYVPWIALAERMEHDGYLYSDKKAGYFLDQRIPKETQFREKVVCTAKSYLMTPYRWAGKSQQGIDCSGLTFMCYFFAGVLIYRDAKIHPGYPIKSISFDRIGKGDLLYFPGHVGLYIGDGRFIHATGNEKSFACVVSSLRKEDALYREDLRHSLYGVGSLF